MNRTDINGIVATRAKGWLAGRLDNTAIASELLQIGIEDRHIPEILQEINKLRDSRKTAKGLTFVALGALVCLLSCVLTILMSQSDMQGVILYGMTSVGLLIIFAGLISIFG